MGEVVLVLSKELAHILLIISILCIYTIVTGVWFHGLQRRKVFTPGFVEDLKHDLRQEPNFKDQDISNGWPDQGCNRFSKKLNYKLWYDFNVSQRMH